MVNSRKKGHRTVAHGRKRLHALGYVSANLEQSGRTFGRDRDLFGLWDYLFIRGRIHLFIQFKTNLGGVKWMQPYRDFAQLHGSAYVQYEIWIWFDREGFKIIRLNPDGN